MNGPPGSDKIRLVGRARVRRDDRALLDSVGSALNRR